MQPRPCLIAITSLAALCACSSSPNDNSVAPPAPPPTWTISNSSPFAGSMVAVHSTGVKSLSASAFVELGSTSVPVTRVDDSTATVQLPTTIDGTFSPTLVDGTYQVPLGSIQIYGFHDANVWGSAFDIGIVWDAYPFTVRGRAEVIGSHGYPADGLTMIDLDDGSYQIVPIGYSVDHGPGPTENDSVWAYERYDATHDKTWIELWNIGGLTPVRVDSLQSYRYVSFNWQSARLGPQSWLSVPKGPPDHVHRADGADTDFNVTQARGIVMSPTHDRVVVRGGSATEGRPVFAVPSGNTAFVVNDFPYAEGAAFSSDGTLLGLGDWLRQLHVSILKAIDGTVLGDTTITHEVFGLAMDDTRPLMYVGVTDTDGVTPVILVFQRDPMHLVGRLKPPATARGCGTGGVGCYGGIMFQFKNRLYVWWSFQDTAQSWRFDLPTP